MELILIAIPLLVILLVVVLPLVAFSRAKTATEECNRLLIRILEL